MRFTEAFRMLGYKVTNARQDWSADNPHGVCITLWQKEMGFANGVPWVDTEVHAQDNSLWRHKPGNKKRILHLLRALSEFAGVVDVVIVHGNPGQGFGDAAPWFVQERRGARWKVEAVDPTTGHFKATVVPG